MTIGQKRLEVENSSTIIRVHRKQHLIYVGKAEYVSGSSSGSAARFTDLRRRPSPRPGLAKVVAASKRMPYDASCLIERHQNTEQR